MLSVTIAAVLAAAEPITVLLAAKIIVDLRTRLAEFENVRAWELGR